MLGVPLQAQPPQQVLLSALDQLVEDEEVALSVVLVHHPRLLQQVVDDVATHRGTLQAEGRRGGAEGGRCKEEGVRGRVWVEGNTGVHCSRADWV